eukprot:scaffold108882_cov20-Prasinocladus_malaysianus.AAC.1
MKQMAFSLRNRDWGRRNLAYSRLLDNHCRPWESSGFGHTDAIMIHPATALHNSDWCNTHSRPDSGCTVMMPACAGPYDLK